MSFFLLGKSAEGTLFLLSDAVFSSRQDALTELSRLTSSPQFDSWDSEVMVIDLDTGTPVLLVRPTGGSEESESTGGDVPTASSETAEEPDAALAAVMEDLGVEGGAQAGPVADDETEASAEGEGADTFVAEAEEAPVVEVDEAWAAAVVETEAGGDALKGALKRTAAQMEAQGISAPESVGPADTAESIEVEAHDTEAEADLPEAAQGAEAAPDQAVETSEEPGEEVAAEAREESQPQEEAAPDAGGGEPARAEEEPQLADETASEPAWPWDAADAESGSGKLSALEEPSLDTESMIRALAEDEASRTVVLGEYDGSDIADTEPELIVSAAAIEAEKAAEAAAEEAAAGSVPDASDAESSAAPEEASETTQDQESDFIDLGHVAVAEAKSYEPGEPDMEGMTCDDCVYVDTCPNKDERIPATCGSFQWK